MIERMNPTLSRMLHEEKSKQLIREADIERKIRESKESPEQTPRAKTTPKKRAAKSSSGERAKKRR